MARLRYNGLTATLGAALTSSGTAVTFGAALTYSNGVAVPTITGSDYIPLTILNSSGNLSEIVSLTAYTSGATTGTISRAQEGTTGVAHSSGDKVVHGATSADFGIGPSVDAQTATTYTLAMADANNIVTMNNASGSTLTLPANSSVALPVGTRVDLIQIGVGQTTVALGSGVTVNGSSNPAKVSKINGRVVLTKLGTDTWNAAGDVLGILGGTGTSSMPTYQTYVPANALDGDMSTRWGASRGPTSGDTFTVDLGATKTVTAVNIWQGVTDTDGCGFPSWVVETSPDNTTWTSLGSGTTQIISLGANNLQLRYVRLRATASSGNWTSIREFQVTGY